MFNMISKNKIKGPAFPVITPFKNNGELDTYILEKYIRFLCENGAKIIYTMAHSSRLGLMSTNEIIKLNNIVCKVTKQYFETIAIAATPMYRDTNTIVNVAKKAADSGADLISVIFNERYYCDKQIIEFFETVARSVKCGILIHEEQLNTIYGTKKINWPLDLLEKIINISNVIAIKEDAKDDGYTETIVKKFHQDAAIVVSGGSKKQFIKFAPMGCQSYLVGLGSFDPKISIEFYNHYLNNDILVCENIINNIETPFFDVSKKLGWHIGIKSAMEHMGLMPRFDRRPLMELDKGGHEEIENVLKKLGYLDKKI